MYADLPPPIPDIALSSAGGRPLRVAVVGSGIAGLAVAHSLRGLARVTLFEAGDYFGGHTHTVDITLPTANGPVPWCGHRFSGAQRAHLSPPAGAVCAVGCAHCAF